MHRHRLSPGIGATLLAAVPALAPAQVARGAQDRLATRSAEWTRAPSNEAPSNRAAGDPAALWLERIDALPGGPPNLVDPATPERCRARRQRVAAALGDGVFFAAAGEKDHGRFLADDDFYWLSGVSVGGALLVLEAAGGELVRERLYLPPFDRRYQVWHGERLSPGPAARAVTGIRDTRPLSSVERDVLDLVASTHRFVGRGEPIESLIGRSGRRATKPLFLLKDVQAVKEPEELVALEIAVDITQAALAEGMAAAVPGAWEFTVEAAVESGFRRRGADGPAFASICGAGPNSCVLHYRENDRQLEPGDLLLIDVGAKYRHYSADVTRTLPVSGEFSARQREVYLIVWEAGRRAAALLRPGVKMREVHNAAAEFLAQHGYGPEAFPHAIGHGLGLRIRDFPWKEDPLEPGMVVTIEPGVYLPGEALGIRIEDVYAITEGGARLLSDALPSHPDDVEAVLAALRRRR